MKTSPTQSSTFVKSPFRYPGGKYYALKFILPFVLSVSHDEYREPFVGGGNVFFAKPKSKINWLNDLESDLITVYKLISNTKSRNKFTDLLSGEIANRERHAEIKAMNPSNLLESAFRTYYLNRTSYSGIINNPAWGYKDGKSSPPRRWRQMIEPAGVKLRNVKLSSKDFEEIICAKQTGESVLLYLDPPYYLADQKRAYNKSFLKEDHERLASILRKTSYNFCLSYDDCQEVRKLYKWALIFQRRWLYNTANCRGSIRKHGEELIITNYEMPLFKPVK